MICITSIKLVSCIKLIVTVFLFYKTIVTARPMTACEGEACEFPLSIIHINDFHARFEETDELGGDCKEDAKCIGGYARIVTVIKQLRAEGKNTLYLNAGDNFQGTLWYNLGKWNVTEYFLDKFPADVMTLGNHEFDDQIAGVLPFMENIQSPVVVANIDDSLEPEFQGKYTKSVILERSGRKIGVIGIIANNTDNISRPGRIKFLDEIESAKAEAQRLKEEQGVDIIIVVSHIGLEDDYEMAKHGGPYIDVIVGGHSHTFLWSGDNPPGKEKPLDEYPVVVTQSSGRKVLIVQAASYARFVGNLTVYFDQNGEIIRHEGAPVYLDTNIPQDPEIVEELKVWKDLVHAKGEEVVGSSRVVMSREECRQIDCNIGNFVTDAYVHEYASKHTGEYWTPAAIAIMNAGGIRSNIYKGNVTFSQIITTSPFENTIDIFDLEGRYLMEALEHSVAIELSGFRGKNMLQVSGLRIVYDPRKPLGQRIVSAKARCQKCDTPKYEPIKLDETYSIISASFVIEGGDGYLMIRDNKKNHKVGPKDYDVLVNFAKFSSPITIGQEERIQVLA